MAISNEVAPCLSQETQSAQVDMASPWFILDLAVRNSLRLCAGHGTDTRRLAIRWHNQRRPTPMGYTREAAARYSFLLAIPAVLASGFIKFIQAGASPGIAPGPTLLATIVAFLSGYAVIIAFLKLVSTRSYMPFVYYRCGVGALLLLALWMGWLAPS